MASKNPIRISIDDSDIQDLAKRALKKSGDMSEEMTAVAGIMLDAVEQNFEEEGRPERWHPLAEPTKEQRQELGFGRSHPILQREGTLAAANQADSSSTSAEVTNATEYGPIHHFGGKAGRGKKVTIPERPFMVLTDEDIEEILEVLTDLLE